MLAWHRNVKGFLRSQPDANIISVSQNDNGNYCQTPEETAIMDEEGSPMGPLTATDNLPFVSDMLGFGLP